MQIRYLETLKQVGRANTKVIFVPELKNKERVNHLITQGLINWFILYTQINSKLNLKNHFMVFTDVGLEAGWHNRWQAIQFEALTMKGWRSDHRPYIIKGVFDTQIDFLQQSSPRCMPCCHRRRCTCEQATVEPKPLHSRSPYGYWASLLESQAFLIDVDIPRVYHGDIVGLHLNASKQSCVRLSSVPSKFKNRPSSICFILNRRVL